MGTRLTARASSDTFRDSEKGGLKFLYPKLALFEGREIRKALQDGEWWFSIIDVIEALVGGDRPRKYWSDLKKKLIAEGYFEVSGGEPFFC